MNAVRRALRRPSVLLATAAATALATLVVAFRTGRGGAVAVPGIVDAGAVTRWGLPVARTLMDAAGVTTVGALLLVVVLLPGGGEGRGRLSRVQARYVGWAAVAAACWALGAAATLLFTLSDLFARPVGRMLAPAVVADFVVTDPQGRSYATVVAVVAVLATVCLGTGTIRWARGALLLAVAGLLPPAFTGHPAAAAQHDTAVVSLALHLTGVAVWAGGLLFVLLVAAPRKTAGATVTGGQLAVVVGRFSPLAGWALLAVAASGVTGATVRLDGFGELFTSRYGWLLLGKAAALGAVGLCGAWHRRRTLPALRGHADGGAARNGGRAGGIGTARRAFVRLAAVELLLMAAATGLAVGLSRTPPPTNTTSATGSGTGTGTGLSPAEQSLGFALPRPLGDFPWTPLFTEWRFDPLFAFGTAAAGLLYAAGVRTLARRGDRWPPGRTVAWFLGLAVTVVGTMSGLSVYGKVLFSVHMGQHMLLAMTVPILLVLGAPATLALRALPKAPEGGGSGPRELLLGLLHSRWVKVISHPVVASVLFIGSAFAVYFTSLFPTLMSSHLGHLAMLVHFLLTGLLIILAVQWVRSDAREARRVDRRIDRGDANDPLAAYNAYLAALHARDRRPGGADAGPPGEGRIQAECAPHSNGWTPVRSAHAGAVIHQRGSGTPPPARRNGPSGRPPARP
ncbi:cytochrome c oxidase assembly protein [Streptomyces sp. NPDC090025]|uniref:cytochrome c oxidase assembly protein n=1 Tax=Streptomyces sp. NPDC090025 TaxID=3365922 RepID=UPI003836EF3C